MSRVAVIGSGIAGLAAAWFLSRQHDVLLFERDDRLGGHTHTHHVDTPDGPLALDTGFLVHNDRTYPNLIRLFDEIGVSRHDSDMTFGVSDPRTGFEYSTRDLNGLFAQRSNLLRPSHYRLLLEILRFNREATHTAVEAGSEDTGAALDVSLGEWLDARRFSGPFLDRFLFPLAASIWSASTATLRDFPAMTLIRFFHNHGMSTTLDHPAWKVVAGGSATYIPRLLAPARITVRTGCPVRRVRREADRVLVTLDDGPVEVDHVVFACHGDEVLPLLTDATVEEQVILGRFRTTPNVAVLHTDGRWLPRRPAARAAWNYRLGDTSSGATVTYYLNRLQGLATTRDYCVTLNPTAVIPREFVLGTMTYTHPLYTRDAVASQREWARISGLARTHFCGAYWFYGFHEDGLRSALRVAEGLGVRW